MTADCKRIHICGAFGSGKTALGASVARELQAKHLDVDDFVWVDSDPPFVERRAPGERSEMFRAAIEGVERWVLSGTLLRWGDELTALFDLVVFLYVPAEVRLARLIARERQRYGSNIDPGGRQHESFKTFMAGAHGYDNGEHPVETLANARAWLARLSCPVVEISGVPTLAESTARVVAACRISGAPG